MIITSSLSSIDTFLNIATAAAGIYTIGILYVCVYVHIMHVLYGFMYILNQDFC